MLDLPNVAPLSVHPQVEEGNLLLTLAGLEPGWYSVRDLYPRYLKVEERLKNDPASKISLGMALRSLGVDSRSIHGNTKAWYLNPDLLARASELAQGVDQALINRDH